MPLVDDPRHLCIVGLMGVGKTTVATLVAQRLGRPILDSDRWIERRFGVSGRQIAERDGVGELHGIEAAMLREALTTSPPAVITPAASVAEDQESLRLLRTLAFVVWLDLEPSAAFERASAGAHRRQTTLADFERMHRTRHEAFDLIADVRLDAALLPRELADAAVLAFQSDDSS